MCLTAPAPPAPRRVPVRDGEDGATDFPQHLFSDRAKQQAIHARPPMSADHHQVGIHAVGLLENLRGGGSFSEHRLGGYARRATRSSAAGVYRPAAVRAPRPSSSIGSMRIGPVGAAATVGSGNTCRAVTTRRTSGRSPWHDRRRGASSPRSPRGTGFSDFDHHLLLASCLDDLRLQTNRHQQRSRNQARLLAPLQDVLHAFAVRHLEQQSRGCATRSH